MITKVFEIVPKRFFFEGQIALFGGVESIETCQNFALLLLLTQATLRMLNTKNTLIVI